MRALFALIFCLILTPTHSLMAQDSPIATVISLEGPAWVEGSADQADKRAALDVGDLLAAGDRIITGEGANLHLALTDGASVVLGPNTDMTLETLGDGGETSSSIFKLAKGLLNAMVQKLSPGARFEVQTTNAIAAVKGTDFEVNASQDDTQVTVQEGSVNLSDSFKRKTESVLPDHRAALTSGRLFKANKLSKRELGEYRARWQRSRMIHGQRALLLKQYRSNNTAQRARLKKRLSGRHMQSPREKLDRDRKRLKNSAEELKNQKKKKRKWEQEEK